MKRIEKPKVEADTKPFTGLMVADDGARLTTFDKRRQFHVFCSKFNVQCSRFMGDRVRSLDV